MAAAEKKDGSGSGLSIAIVATVLVALAGVLVGQWQLVGTRPAPTEIAGYPPGTLQDVPGRLWQDPFAAIDQVTLESGPRTPRTTRIRRLSARAAIVSPR
jgi:hypothetical protein